VAAEEVEVKLACGPGFSEQTVVAWLRRRATVEGPVEALQRDVYLDTRADELAAAGLAARHRLAAGLRTIEVKPVPIEPGLVLARAEYTRALVRDEDPGEAVRKLVERELGLALSEAPREVVTLETVRRRFAVDVPQARLELCVDSVTAAEPHGRRASFGELELELRKGSMAALDELGRDLARRGGLSPSRRTKFERARELLGLAAIRYGARSPTLFAEQPLGEAARAVIAAWWNTARAHVAGVRVGLDPEHVHKMRVALRRMRTALRVFEDAFDPALAESLREEVRRVGRLLGEVRDLDVQRLAIADWRRRFHEIEAVAWADIDERMQRRRARARSVLLAELASPKWAALDRAVELCIGSHAAAGRDTLAVRVPTIVMRRVERCERALVKLREDGTARHSHDLRIDVKNLRYTLDFVASALDWECGDIASTLADVQDELGALQDAVQTGRLANELFEMPPRPSSAAAYALGALLGNGRAIESSAFPLANAAITHRALEATFVKLRELVHGHD
jgi:CHAD domain-containing protein